MADFKGFKVDGKEYPWGDYVTVGRQEGSTAGEYSTAEGYSTTASGDESHAEGAFTTALDAASHAEGQHTTAGGSSSHAEGNWATASGTAAHAEGRNTIASGDYAHAEGVVTTANHQAQHVFGSFNIPDASAASSDERGNYVEIVGNGIDASNYSNARTLDWDGNEVLAGKLTVGSAPTNLMDVTTKQYVDSHTTLSYLTKTLEASQWSNNQYVLQDAQLSANATILVVPEGSTKTEYLASNVQPYSQAEGSITFMCDFVPSIDVVVILIIF